MNEYELIEFFGVLPEEDEEDCYDSFRVERDGVVLKFVRFYSAGFSLSVFQNDNREPVFSTGAEGDFRVKRVTYKNNYDCLEITVPYSNRYGETDWNYSYKFKVFIEPGIKIEIL